VQFSCCKPENNSISSCEIVLVSHELFLFKLKEMSQLSKVDELLNKGQFEHADMLLRKAEKESLNSEALRAYFSFLFYLVFWNDLISEEASSKE